MYGLDKYENKYRLFDDSVVPFILFLSWHMFHPLPCHMGGRCLVCYFNNAYLLCVEFFSVNLTL